VNRRLSKQLSDGWFATGEVGRWNSDGCLSVYGHKSELLRTSGDHLVFARFLEHIYLESVFVQQIFVTCQPGQPLVAIVVVDREVVFWWAKANHVEVRYSHTLPTPSKLHPLVHPSTHSFIHLLTSITQQHDYDIKSLCNNMSVIDAVLDDLDAVASYAEVRCAFRRKQLRARYCVVQRGTNQRGWLRSYPSTSALERCISILRPSPDTMVARPRRCYCGVINSRTAIAQRSPPCIFISTAMIIRQPSRAAIRTCCRSFRCVMRRKEQRPAKSLPSAPSFALPCESLAHCSHFVLISMIYLSIARSLARSIDSSGFIIHSTTTM